MVSDKVNTQRYFNSAAAEFDKFYSGSSLFRKYFDRIFRAGIYDRYRLVFDECGDVKGKRILDVGCGSGRYAVEFVRRGAERVVGIDFAPHMIQLAKNLALEKQVSEVCGFIQDDFLTHDFGEQRFDISIAMGFFDYIKDPYEYLTKMANLSRERIMVSFPAISLLRMPQRKVRYFVKKCPVYFFSKERLKDYVLKIGIKDFQIIPYRSGGYMLAMDLKS